VKLKELLIVGIDPGTTTAYALLDLNGNLLDVNSSKNYDLGTLIKVIAEKGLPLIVGCDKKNVPWFVQDFATKTGAKVISPEEDLKVAEKKDIARLFKEKAANTHEDDAIASALFAFRRKRALLEKIYNTLKRENKLEKIKEVTRTVFSTEEGLPIRLALDIVEKPDDEYVKAVKKAIEEEMPKEFIKLYEKLYESLYPKMRQLEVDNQHFKEYNKTLKEKNDGLSRDFQQMLGKISKRVSAIKGDKALSALKDKLDKKHIEIQDLKLHLAEKESVIEESTAKISALNEIIRNAQKYVILIKVKNFGEEFSRARIYEKLNAGDIIFVEDASIYSEQNINNLKRKVEIIVCDKPNKILKENFIIIEKNKLFENVAHKETDEFLFVEKEGFNKLAEASIDKSVLLHKILNEYKEEREN